MFKKMNLGCHDIHTRYYSLPNTLNSDYGYSCFTQELYNQVFNINHKILLKIIKINGILCTTFSQTNRKYNS